MPKIKIHRTSQYSNRFRNIGLYLDGNKIVEIADGKSTEFEVEKGQHNLIAKIDWATSNEINFDVNEEDVGFNLAGTSPFLALYYISFGRKNYLRLERI